MNTTAQTRVSLFFLIVILYGDLNVSRKFIQRATMTQLQKKKVYVWAIDQDVVVIKHVRTVRWISNQNLTRSEPEVA